jgi:hypothetical protein
MQPQSANTTEDGWFLPGVTSGRQANRRITTDQHSTGVYGRVVQQGSHPVSHRIMKEATDSIGVRPTNTKGDRV